MSEEAAEQSIRRAKKELSKKQRSLDPETLALHRFIILATSLPQSISSNQVLELYRARWQVELAFKRLKSIMGLGHLPKEDEESAKAWLHGKLLVSCLAQAIVDEGRFFPLGDTPCDENTREASLWRGLSFALHLVRQVVNPPLHIDGCLEKWQEIATKLAEPPKRQSYQMRKISKVF